MKSLSRELNKITLPSLVGHRSMIPFSMRSLEGLNTTFQIIARRMLQSIKDRSGVAFFTIHGKNLNQGDTLRRGGAHTDGSYDQKIFSWGGGGGWKVGENGPSLGSSDHDRLYNSNKGGIILASNFESCLGWSGEFEGLPSVGGDCSHIKLNKPFTLKRNTVYYGNNHFIHESLPVSEDVHRVFARITLPETHHYEFG